MKNRSADIGIFWDMDGVLVGTFAFHYLAWREVLNDLGIMLSEGTFRSHFGINNKHFLRKICGEGMDAKQVLEIVASKEKRYRAMLVDQDILFPGVKSILQDFQDTGFVQVIITSAPWENIHAIMSQTGLELYFDKILSTDGKVSKEYPDPFINAAKKMNLSPRNCVVVEDSVHGLKGAQTAGMICVGVATTHSHEQLQIADLIIDTAGEISSEIVYELVNGPQGGNGE